MKKDSAVSPTLTTASLDERKAASTALAYEHVKFKSGGRSRAGVDCLGLVIATFDINPNDDDYAIGLAANYPCCARKPDDKAQSLLLVFLDKHFKKCNEISEGKVVAFKIKNKNSMPDHVGIMTKRGIVHATTSGVSVAPFDDLKKYVYQIYRIN